MPHLKALFATTIIFASLTSLCNGQTVQGSYARALTAMTEATKPLISSLREIAETSCPADKLSAVGRGCRAFFQVRETEIEFAITDEMTKAFLKSLAGDPNPNKDLTENIRRRLLAIQREVERMATEWQAKKIQ